MKPKSIDFKLEGRRALVTGSASGIGFATAQRLARSGAHVAMNDLPADALARSVIVYLCTGAAYITGEVIPVTGGSRI